MDSRKGRGQLGRGGGHVDVGLVRAERGLSRKVTDLSNQQ